MAAAGPAMKVAIVGSGPSAFYAASRLLAAADTGSMTERATVASVHMYERLPTPHGLVRYGVAPDHPEVKNVEHKFAQVAQHPRFRFFGNVNIVENRLGGEKEGLKAVGEPSAASQSRKSLQKSSPTYPYPHALQMPLQDILPHYTHILFAYGCSQSRELGIPGSRPGELSNVHPALDFVNWYNGHPAAHDAGFLASRPWRRIQLGSTNGAGSMRHASIIGAGNVALDVARILLRSSSTLHPLFKSDSSIKARAALRETDVPEPVLAELARCSIEHVDIVARRGPAQVAFTSKELREMMNLQDVAFKPPSSRHFKMAHEQIAAMEKRSTADASPELITETRVRKRLLGILEKGSSADPQSAVTWGLDFLKSPSALRGGSQGETAHCPPVTGVEWDEMDFEPVPSVSDRDRPWAGGSSARIQSTGRQSSTATDLVVSSVGYRAEPLSQGMAGDDVSEQGNAGILPWDARSGSVRNDGGQVIDATGKAIPGMYASGWVARGPVGVIASTRIDANSVASQMLHDWNASRGKSHLAAYCDSGQLDLDAPHAIVAPSSSEAQAGKRVVSWQDWLRLDAYEQERGKELGKLREKFTSVEEMLQFLG